MADILLTQQEADSLIALEKHRTDDRYWEFPQLGGRVAVPLQSVDGKEQFVLDLSRGRIDLRKGTYQSRARYTVVLIRLDFGGAPHRNPDGEEIGCPHIHVYREGFGDKWASPLPEGRFSNLNDAFVTLTEFMAFCNVTKMPNVLRGLFA